MKKYRLGYDYLFLPNESFTYNDDYIGAMCVTVLFRKVDDEGNEIPFVSEEIQDQFIYYKDGEDYYLCDVITCSFDREKILNFTPNVLLLDEINPDYSIVWEVHSYEKDIDEGILEPKEISKDEFMDIMKNNLDRFDNINNAPAQTTSYITQDLETLVIK